AWLIEPSLFHGRPVAVGVEVTGYTKGHSYADYRGQTGRPANTTLVTGVDEAGFREFVIGRIAAYGGRTDHHAVE
ncbi:MAG: nucleoside hydrolase, partial [Alphaproteobacteria bacterium]|nr:nucleoside hydrolase [Alphaproteobacteria bacterium]